MLSSKTPWRAMRKKSILSGSRELLVCGTEEANTVAGVAQVARSLEKKCRPSNFTQECMSIYLM